MALKEDLAVFLGRNQITSCSTTIAFVLLRQICRDKFGFVRNLAESSIIIFVFS